MKQSDILISLRDVGVTYGISKLFSKSKQNHALNNVNLEILKGETLGIVGGNGSGKSTLLKLLADVFKPDRGEIWRKQGTRASLLTLSLGFDQKISGRDNALFGSMLLGHKKVSARSKLEQIKEFSGLGAAFDDPVNTYSTGMKARLAFTIALQMESDVMLIDEILGVGDMEFRRKAESMITKHINSDQTVVLVSHSLEQIESLCDRALWLSQGAVKMCGDPTEIIKLYKEGG